MQKEMTRGLNQGAIIVVGALLLASCAARQPAQTTINVNVPAAKSEGASETEIANLRDSNDVSSPQSAAKKADAKPTNREGGDAATAKKSVATSAARKPKSQLLDFYDRLPGKHFAPFGGVNRRSLLNRKGAIVDYAHNFIEIPGSADERDGDLHKLQNHAFSQRKRTVVRRQSRCVARWSDAGRARFLLWRIRQFRPPAAPGGIGLFPLPIAQNRHRIRERVAAATRPRYSHQLGAGLRI